MTRPRISSVAGSSLVLAGINRRYVIRYGSTLVGAIISYLLKKVLFPFELTSFIRLERLLKMTKLSVNRKQYETSADPSTLLLWVLRDELGLTGTKFGCGIAQCGSCTVHVDGEARRSCVTPVSAVVGKEVTTIEGLSPDSSHPLQKAWIETDAPQCGYCQSGQIMAAAVLLKNKPQPTDADIDQAMTGIICRCGTYNRIRSAIKLAAKNGGK